MELQTTSRMRRNGQLDKVLSKKSAAPDCASKAGNAQKQQTSDRCSLSRQALACLEQQNRLQQELEERRAQQKSRLDGVFSEAQSKEKELDLLNKAIDTMRKCMKIAASIMKGNKVPPEDLKYLMENDPDGYKMALALRKDNPDPKDEKSVLSDEDRNGGSVASSDSGADAPEVSAPEPSSGGGETSGSAE